MDLQPAEEDFEFCYEEFMKLNDDDYTKCSVEELKSARESILRSFDTFLKSADSLYTALSLRGYKERSKVVSGERRRVSRSVQFVTREMKQTIAEKGKEEDMKDVTSVNFEFTASSVASTSSSLRRRLEAEKIEIQLQQEEARLRARRELIDLQLYSDLEEHPRGPPSGLENVPVADKQQRTESYLADISNILQTDGPDDMSKVSGATANLPVAPNVSAVTSATDGLSLGDAALFPPTFSSTATPYNKIPVIFHASPGLLSSSFSCFFIIPSINLCSIGVFHFLINSDIICIFDSSISLLTSAPTLIR